MPEILQSITLNEVNDLAALSSEINAIISFGETFWLSNQSFEAKGQWLRSSGSYSLALSLRGTNYSSLDELEGLNITLGGQAESGRLIQQSGRLSPAGTTVIPNLPVLKFSSLTFDFEQILQQIDRGSASQNPDSCKLNKKAEPRIAADPQRQPISLMDGPDFKIMAGAMSDGSVELTLDRLVSTEIKADALGTFKFKIDPAGITVTFVLDEQAIQPPYKRMTVTDHGILKDNLWGASAPPHSARLIEAPEGSRVYD